LIRPHVLLVILGGIDHGTGFKHGYLDAERCQHLNHGAAAGAGADDDDVVEGGTADYLHNNASIIVQAVVAA
jgi:hypothetical protein